MSDYTAFELLKDIVCYGSAAVLGGGVVAFILFAITGLMQKFFEWVGEHK